MRIEVANLEDGKGEFAHVYQPAELAFVDDRVRLCAEVSIAGNVRQNGTQILIDGHLSTCAEVECDRCLKPIQVPISPKFSLEYVTESEYEGSRTAELTEDLMSVSVFDGEFIDVDEIVKEQVLLSVPTRLLCKADCQGFCENCGADKNAVDCGCVETEIDPRWAALKDLMNGKQ